MKAQFYSILAIVLTLPIFVFMTGYLAFSQKASYGLADRVISDQLHQLAGSIELDTEKAMEIAGRRALLAAANYVVGGGEPLEDSVANLTALMIYGTLNGSYSYMMINNTIPNWSAAISSKPVDFDVSLSYGNLSIENHDGYSLMIGLDINLTVSDKLGIAKIERTDKRMYKTISLVGLEDPMFPMETQGFIRRIIRRPDTPHFSLKAVTGTSNTSGECSGPVTFNKSEDDDTKILVAENLTGVVYSNHLGIILEDSDNLTGQIGCYLTGNGSAVEIISGIVSSGYEGIYIHEGSLAAYSLPCSENLDQRYYYRGNGPDFLGRLEGNYTPSANGLVTFIYVPEMEEQAFQVEDYSRVAHLYFSETTDCEKMEEMPAWFGIDSSHADEFNVTDILTGESCYTWSPS